MIKIDKDLIWLLRGSQREMLFLNLPNDPFMSNKLRKELNEKFSISLSLREMSRHLRDLEKRKVIKCLNCKDSYNRIYFINKKGLRLKKELEIFEKINKVG